MSSSRTRGQPSWRHESARPHEGSLRDVSLPSILKIHRGARQIVLAALMEQKMGQAETQDLHYGLDLMLDCMGELLYRVRELETGKAKPCKSKKRKSKSSPKTRTTAAATTGRTSKQSSKASKPSGSRSRSSSTTKAKSSQATGRSKPRKNSAGKRSKRS